MKIFKVPYIDVDTFEEYMQVPLNHREVFVEWWPGRWYRTPYAMLYSSLTETTEWDKFENYVKDKYPVQFFLRDTLYWFTHNTYRDLKHVMYKVSYHFRNPRREMMKAVFPPEYQDLDTHIVEFHIQCIIEYVDREKCFETINFDARDEDKVFANELKDLYEYVKVNRNKLKAELEEAWKRVPDEGDYHVIYKEVNDKEAWIKECDTKLCEWVIKNRERLWT